MRNTFGLPKYSFQRRKFQWISRQKIVISRNRLNQKKGGRKRRGEEEREGGRGGGWRRRREEKEE